MTDEMLDCLIVGGGPAGLTAAIYISRFHMRVAVADSGNSRAAWIPKTRNHAGFPEGITGVDLLERMRDQALLYGTRLYEAEVTAIERDGDDFRAMSEAGVLRARTVLLATGVVNRRPPMEEALHAEALARGLIRYCPICDGYEVTDRRVAVIGTGERGTREARFLRSYTADLTLIAPEGEHALGTAQRLSLEEAGVTVIDGPVTSFSLADKEISLETSEGRLSFDSLYPAMGSDIRSELAASLGAETSEDGCLLVDMHQRTSVPGLYAAGDVVKGLDQISHATGEGGVAATTIRNDLAERHRYFR